ncbi:MAG: hypothetical protein WBC44_00180 [Planctomycetaceae bacterium]
MFWTFWGPTIFFTTLAVFAVLFGVLAVRLRETVAATASEAVARGTWALAATAWFGWTIPQAEAQFRFAMNHRYYTSGVWDPTELIFRTFVTPTPAADAFDWYLGLCGSLLAATVIDVSIFYRLHRNEMTRLVARFLSGIVTVLIVLPVWLMNMIVAMPLAGVWRSLP